VLKKLVYYGAAGAMLVPVLGTGLLLGAAALWAYRYATRGYKVFPAEFESDGAVIRGNLLLPDGPGPHPAVVLVHGMFLGLRSFYRFYADFFARQGFAVLVYDKRGSGASGGKPSLLDLEQQARDAAAAWHWLERHYEIDSRRVGFWGYSLGGAATLKAAELVPDPAFVIGLSQPALPLGEILMYYSAALLPGPAGDQAKELRQQLWDYSRDRKGWKKIYKALEEAQTKPWYKAAGLPLKYERLLPGETHDPSAELPFRWDNADLDYDPLPALAKLNCPILLQYGDRDWVVPSREFIRRVERFREVNELPDLEVLTYKGGDHAMHKPWLPFNVAPFFCKGYLREMITWLDGVSRQRVKADNLARLQPVPEKG
jgi:dienelactone hydrolase